MQDEVNEKVVSLAIKTSKLTAEVLQKAMKALLAKGKGQLTKAPHGKITMRQLMKQGEGGKIINVCSMLSYQGGIRVPSYTASKSAIIGLTRAYPMNGQTITIM